MGLKSEWKILKFIALESLERGINLHISISGVPLNISGVKVGTKSWHPIPDLGIVEVYTNYSVCKLKQTICTVYFNSI